MWTVALVLMSAAALLVEGYGPHHPHGSRHHHHPPAVHSGVKLTQNEPLLRDRNHIQEDLREIVQGDITEGMSPKELEFYYFKIHDADNNTQLDGLEILHAVQHTSHDDSDGESPLEDFSSLVHLIDEVLAEDDVNNDGYLSYVEYVRGREKGETRERNYKKHVE